MPRRPRVNLIGYPQHVVQRGHNRAASFFGDEDYHCYLHWLKDAAHKYRCDIHAYALMTNHVHLLVSPGQADGITRLMQSLGRRYAQYLNRTYKRSGSVWEGRFKASVIDAEEYLLACYRYIELNPVTAGMVNDPAEYRWTSYRWHGLGEANPLITDHPLYLALAAEATARREVYRSLFRVHLDDAALADIRTALQHGQPLGNERFREQVGLALGKRLALKRRGRKREEGVKDEAGQMVLGL
jgi:putative transposase